MSEKHLSGVRVKDADQGTVEAVFSTFGVKDLDGDVTMPDAFEDGAEVQISAYGHTSWGGQLPVGKGRIRVTHDHAVLDGQFFLNTTHGRDTFETIKQIGDLQQWSYGFKTLKADRGEHKGENVQFLRKLAVTEVSPVLRGAGIATRTLAVKNAVEGLGEGIRDEAKSFLDEADSALGCVKALITRADALGALRAEKQQKEGRVLSAANRERLSSLHTSLGEASEALAVLLADSDPNQHTDALLAEAARFERLRATI